MKLKEYIKKLKILEKNHSDLEVIYAHDDEGNAFQQVEMSLGVMYIKDINSRYLETCKEGEGVSVICIN